MDRLNDSMDRTTIRMISIKNIKLVGLIMIMKEKTQINDNYQLYTTIVKIRSFNNNVIFNG